jgi:hypothetical protein
VISLRIFNCNSLAFSASPYKGALLKGCKLTHSIL